jgi:hypothetical protein
MAAIVDATVRVENAKRAKPWPTCADCGQLFMPEDEHWLWRLCHCCGLNRGEKLLQRWVFARGRRARKRALKKLKRLAK